MTCESNVYFIANAAGTHVKIGRSERPERRVLDLQIGNHDQLSLLHTVSGGVLLEAYLHSRYAAWRRLGEWFEISPKMRRDIEMNNFPDEADLAAVRGYVPKYPVYQKPRVQHEGIPRLWQHKNGIWYILFGIRQKSRISTLSKDRSEAEKVLAQFIASSASHAA